MNNKNSSCAKNQSGEKLYCILSTDTPTLWLGGISMLGGNVKHLFLLLFFSLMLNIGISQPTPKKIIILEGNIKLIDSQYILIPQIKILSKDEKIQIVNNIFYEDCHSILANCKMYFQKQLPKVYVNLSLDGLTEPSYLPGRFDLRDYGFNDTLKDTINLKYYYPLEIGNYRLKLELEYYYKMEKQTIESEWIYFEVSYAPKDPFY